MPKTGDISTILSYLRMAAVSTMPFMKTCTVCGKVLRGRQSKYCSRRCKNADTNCRHQSYLAQQKRGHERKERLVSIKGGECQRCGYRKNLAALEFHHVTADEKEFQLDLRSLSNRSWPRILREARKCILVCSNCHRELHNPGKGPLDQPQNSGEKDVLAARA